MEYFPPFLFIHESCTFSTENSTFSKRRKTQSFPTDSLFAQLSNLQVIDRPIYTSTHPQLFLQQNTTFQQLIEQNLEENNFCTLKRLNAIKLEEYWLKLRKYLFQFAFEDDILSHFNPTETFHLLISSLAQFISYFRSVFGDSPEKLAFRDSKNSFIERITLELGVLCEKMPKKPSFTLIYWALLKHLSTNKYMEKLLQDKSIFTQITLVPSTENSTDIMIDYLLDILHIPNWIEICKLEFKTSSNDWYSFWLLLESFKLGVTAKENTDLAPNDNHALPDVPLSAYFTYWLSCVVTSADATQSLLLYLQSLLSAASVFFFSPHELNELIELIYQRIFKPLKFDTEEALLLLYIRIIKVYAQVAFPSTEGQDMYDKSGRRVQLQTGGISMKWEFKWNGFISKFRTWIIPHRAPVLFSPATSIKEISVKSIDHFVLFYSELYREIPHSTLVGCTFLQTLSQLVPFHDKTNRDIKVDYKIKRILILENIKNMLRLLKSKFENHQAHGGDNKIIQGHVDELVGKFFAMLSQYEEILIETLQQSSTLDLYGRKAYFDLLSSFYFYLPRLLERTRLQGWFEKTISKILDFQNSQLTTNGSGHLQVILLSQIYSLLDSNFLVSRHKVQDPSLDDQNYLDCLNIFSNYLKNSCFYKGIYPLITKYFKVKGDQHPSDYYLIFDMASQILARISLYVIRVERAVGRLVESSPVASWNSYENLYGINSNYFRDKNSYSLHRRIAYFYNFELFSITFVNMNTTEKEMSHTESFTIHALTTTNDIPPFVLFVIFHLMFFENSPEFVVLQGRVQDLENVLDLNTWSYLLNSFDCEQAKFIALFGLSLLQRAENISNVNSFARIVFWALFDQLLRLERTLPSEEFMSLDWLHLFLKFYHPSVVEKECWLDIFIIIYKQFPRTVDWSPVLKLYMNEGTFRKLLTFKQREESLEIISKHAFIFVEMLRTILPRCTNEMLVTLLGLPMIRNHIMSNMESCLFLLKHVLCDTLLREQITWVIDLMYQQLFCNFIQFLDDAQGAEGFFRDSEMSIVSEVFLLLGTRFPEFFTKERENMLQDRIYLVYRTGKEFPRCLEEIILSFQAIVIR